MANPDAAPVVKTHSGRGVAYAIAVDGTEEVAQAPFDATITAVTYTPDVTITGANTNSRTVSLINKGQAGSGSTVVATLAFVSGVNASAGTPKTIVLSATPANLLVAAGDVLEFDSTHVGSGIVDPGGLVQVQFTSR